MNTQAALSANQNFSVFDYGFRPFFLMAGLYAVLPLIPWALHWGGGLDVAIPLQGWHSHEMLYGFAFATIGGFMLTAIPSWTNRQRVFGRRLKLIFCVWLLSRILFWLALFIDQDWLRLALFLDLAFPLILAGYAASAILASGNKRNLILVLALLLFTVADALTISNLTGFGLIFDTNGTALSTNVFFILLALIGGRITANFTRSHFQRQAAPHAVRPMGAVDGAAIGSLVLMMVAEFIWPGHKAVSIIALLAGALHLVRFSGWQSLKVLDTPILWVLHLGYVWLITALLLKGMSGVTALAPNLYVHALTIGAVGTYILGVMSRAALGHTGRGLKVSRIIVLAYGLVSFAAILRLLSSFTGIFNAMLLASIALWAIAFALFLFIYAPILTTPRIDGKPG